MERTLDTEDFEGTLVLEKLGEMGLIDEFMDAVDADDFKRAAALMRRANLDSNTISIVLAKMAEADGE